MIGPDGSAVAGASVSIQLSASLATDTLTWNPSEARTTQTDPAGVFVFEGLHGGRYSLRVTSQEWLGARDAVWLTSRTEPIVLRIGEATGFRVQVIDADRRPIAGAIVLAVSEGMTATTDTKGEARLGPLNPNQYAIEVTAAGYAPGRVLAQSGAIGTIGLATITLHRGPSVAGRVVDEHGRAIAAARVFAATSPYVPTDATESATTGVDGAFTIPAVDPGLQWLHAVDGIHAPSSTSILELDEDAIGIEITMKPGRVLTGTVVGSDGTPVPDAHVHLGLPHMKTRPVSTDINGVFVLRGLSPTLHRLYAEAGLGVSQPEIVDLAQDVRDLRLVLESVENSISGVVVDDTGTPLPYVTVHAMSTVQSSANTDAHGQFSISGLGSGTCMLFADRFGRLHRPWTTATVGETGVQLTLPRTGAIKGRAAFADGSRPTSFTVRGVVWDVHGEHGDFEIRDLPPGSFTLTINGAGFVDTTTESVLVEPGKTTELGTVTLDRGRTVSGVVVDGAGRAVTGAKVVIGMAPFADLGNHEEHRLGYRSALSGADGAFSISAVSAKTNIGPSQLAIGADHPIHGRSLPIEIPEGVDDPPSISVSLRPCGSISGRVTQRDTPVTHTVIGCGWPELACAVTDHDGAFLMPRLPEGTFILRTMLPTEGLRAHHTIVQVVGGQRAALTIDVPVGTVTLTIAAQPRPGDQVSAADLFLFAGEVTFATRQQLNAKLFTDGCGICRWRADATEALRVERLVPGSYTICTVPLAGDPNDPDFEQRLSDQSDTLAVVCTPVRVEAAPTEQLASVEVPSPR